jgi:hypothetical protein
MNNAKDSHESLESISQCCKESRDICHSDEYEGLRKVMLLVVGVVGPKFGYSNEGCLFCIQYTLIVVNLLKEIRSTFLVSYGLMNILFFIQMTFKSFT